MSVTSTEQLNVLFIGAGGIVFGNDWVLWNHSLRLEKHLGSRLAVIGIVDPSIERVDQVLAEKRVSEASASYAQTRRFKNVVEAKEAFKAPGLAPNLIMLAAPPHLRGTLTPGHNLEVQLLEAFGSSPAIFCEKPVATARPHEPLEVAKTLEDSGNVVAVGYMLRYLRVVQQAMQIIRRNNLRVMSVVARYTMAYSKTRKVDWWFKSKQCGPIVEQATHFCDLCRYLGGEVVMDSVQAYALEHDEPAGRLEHHDPAIQEERVPPDDRIPRSTTAMWKYETGGLGTLTHTVALHGRTYSNEIVVTADGYQLRLVDLYVSPALYVRSPESEKEEMFTYEDDDPFYTELKCVVDTAAKASNGNVQTDPGSHSDDSADSRSDQILSSYLDACKTYEFTWKIRDESERSSEKFRQQRSCRMNS